MKNMLYVLLLWFVGSHTLAAALTFEQRLLFPNYLQQTRYEKISRSSSPALFTLYFIAKVDEGQYIRGEGWIAISPVTKKPALFTIRHIAYAYDNQHQRTDWIIYTALINDTIFDSKKWLPVTPENTTSGDSIMMQEIEPKVLSKIQEKIAQKKLIVPTISLTSTSNPLFYFDGTLLKFLPVVIDKKTTNITRTEMADKAYRSILVPDIANKNCYVGNYSPLFAVDPFSDPNGSCHSWKKVALQPTNLAIITTTSDYGICPGSSGGALFSQIGFSQWAVVGAISSGPESTDRFCAKKNIVVTTFAF